MKFTKLSTLFIVAVIMNACILTGCTKVDVKEDTRGDVKAGDSNTSSTSFVDDNSMLSQAYETNQELSADQKALEEQTRRDEIAQQYSIYEEFGLQYETEQDRFFYNGQMVRYFSDLISEDNTNGFFYKEGVIDLEPVRSTSGNLTGLKQASDTEFTARTKKQEELEADFYGAGVIDSNECYEMGETNVRDDSLDAYLDYGVSYDSTTKKWIYNKKQIHSFYDEDVITFVDIDVTDGVDLKVVRNTKGKIDKLIEMSNEEVFKLFN